VGIMNKLPMLRVDFRHFWPGFNPEDNFFIKLLRPYYEIALNRDNPDFVFFSVFENRAAKTQKTSKLLRFYKESNAFVKRFSPEAHAFLKQSLLGETIKKEAVFFEKRVRIPVVEGRFVKIFYTAENVIPDMNLCDWAFSFCHDEEFRHPRHMRLPSYVFEGYTSGLIKNTDPQAVLRRKTRFCNFIFSSNVEFRNSFFAKLSRYKRVDAPGRCMNNMPPIGYHDNPLSSRGAADWKEAKVRFLEDYKFTIAFENESYPGYVTEKIVQPMLANSIPIYFGNQLIKRDFNTSSFLSITDEQQVEQLVEKVIEVDRNDDLYASIMREPWLENNRLNRFMEAGRLLKRFELIFNSR